MGDCAESTAHTGMKIVRTVTGVVWVWLEVDETSDTREKTPIGLNAMF